MNENEDGEIIDLVNDEGQVEKFEIIEKFEVEDDKYIAILPLEGEEGVYLYRYEYDEQEEIILSYIEDKDELTNVAAVYEAIIDEII